MATMDMVAMTDAMTGAREDSILDRNYQLSNSTRSWRVAMPSEDVDRDRRSEFSGNRNRREATG